MRVAATADLHGFLPPVPGCDLLVLAGDLAPADDHGIGRQQAWLDGPFRRWLEELPATHVVGIVGNHDFVFERAPNGVPGDLRWTYLPDSSANVAGRRLFGSPWTPWFHDWAFNAPRRDGEQFLTDRFVPCPDDADVLLLHGPPRGMGDRTQRGEPVGSTAALQLIERVRPQLCVFGHIHEARWMGARRGRSWPLAAVDLDYALRSSPSR